VNSPVSPVPAADLCAIARRDERTGPWFDALAAGVLTVRRCARCGHAARPDAATCPDCHSDDLQWATSRGTGTVVSRIVDHSPVGDGGRPLTLGLVELDEGPWLSARLLDDPAIGDPVALVVLAPDEGEPVPGFRRV
jgi:uncharacterized OB-fold protein